MAESWVKLSAAAGAAGLIGGLGGGAFVWAGQGHTLAILPEAISYPDLIAVLLTGVGLLLSVIGLAVAFIAIYGFRHFKKTAEAVATARAAIIAGDRMQSFLSGSEASILITGKVRELVIEILANKETYVAWGKESRAEAAKLDELDRSDE